MVRSVRIISTRRFEDEAMCRFGMNVREQFPIRENPDTGSLNACLCHPVHRAATMRMPFRDSNPRIVSRFLGLLPEAFNSRRAATTAYSRNALLRGTASQNGQRRPRHC